MNRKKIWIALISVIVLVLAWAPWIGNDNARAAVKTYANFQQQHNAQNNTDNPEMNVIWYPFCRSVSTYEGIWFVCFWQI